MLMQMLWSLSAHVGIDGEEVNEKDRLKREDRFSYGTVRTIKKRVDAHRQ